MTTEIQTFGRLVVTRDGADVEALPTGSLRAALLVYVVVEGVVGRRESCELFWPGVSQERARRSLNQAVYVLRQTLGEDVLVTRGDEIARGPDVTVDVDLVNADDVARDDRAALAACRGGFLATWSVPDHRELSLWIDRQRTTLERRIREIRRRALADRRSVGDRPGALAIAREWVDADPLEDEAQHALIEELYAQGRRTAAIEQFEGFRRALREELGVEPLDETLELMRRIHEMHSGLALEADGPSGDRQASDPESHDAVGADDRWDGGDVPDGRGRAHHMRAGTAGLAAVVAAVLVAVAARASDWSWSGSAPRAADPSRVAVLYFDDLSPSGPVDGLASGLTHELIHRLSQVDRLDVVSRHGVRPFAEGSAPLDSIRTRLGVGSLVDGSVQVVGSQVRVLVQLVDPVEHTYLRSATIERPMADIFTLQDDLAEAVATFLRERIGDQLALERARARAPSPEAWLLARGVEALAEPYWRARGRVPIQRGASARATLERADSMAVLLAAREPAWDEGHRLRGMIAIAWERLLAAEEPEVARAHLTAGLAALDVATALEPNRSESWEAIGLLRWRAAIDHHVEEEASGEVERAEDALRRAVRLDEANAGAWAALSLVRQYRGDTSEATQFARRALEEDAFLAAAADVRHRLMIASLDARDFPDADHWCAEGRARHPGDHRFLTCLLTLPGGAGYRVPASTAADSLHAWIAARDPAEPGDGSRDYRFAFRRMMLAEIHARNGDSRGARVHRDSAWAAVRPHEHLRGPFAWDDAALALLLGDTVASVEALAEWARRNPRLLPYLRESWVFEPLESHPAVIEILGGEAATRRP